MKIYAYAAQDAAGKLSPYEFEMGSLRPDEVELDVKYCGICHSDLSMLLNEWGISTYPFVPGHEVVGTIAAVGDHVKHLQPGQTVGLGWFSHSCMICAQCMSGHHNLCPTAEQTIVGRHGGFADKVRAHAEWIIPLPESLDPAKMGPMFCGGITVFNPIVTNDIRPTARVGVVGIGGLGHMALQFLKAWGCEVTAFSTSRDKEEEARGFGAHHFINTRESGSLEKLAASLDMILVTSNVELDWDAYMAALAPRGKLHLVGAAPSVKVTVFPMLGGAKSISGSPLGSPALVAKMLEFSARHDIAPLTELFPMSKVNDAMEHLKSGKARYRIVLEAGK